ncbi:MAG: hypothetical protein L6V93_06835 [Clostridiales bacterium]|nr:MAG: hypothetical protein L6V93_06835 [Clostridiales bacterium]
MKNVKNDLSVKIKQNGKIKDLEFINANIGEYGARRSEYETKIAEK